MPCSVTTRAALGVAHPKIVAADSATNADVSRRRPESVGNFILISYKLQLGRKKDATDDLPPLDEGSFGQALEREPDLDLVEIPL
jgi:hypothetical protein